MTKSPKPETKEARRKTAVIVLGMHRSGTSALGGVLNHLGCDAPKTLMVPHPTNPKGFFESQPIWKLNINILESAGTTWSDWQPLNPGWFDSPRAEQFQEQVRDTLVAEFPNSHLFVLKDPRLCKLLPLYLETLASLSYRPVIAHIHRNPLDVAESIYARDGRDPDLSQLVWLRHVLDAERSSRGVLREFVSYGQLLRDWGGTIDRLGKGLRINWPRLSTKTANDIDEFLTPSLRHHDRPVEQLLNNPLASGWIRDVYAILERWAAQGESKADHAEFDRINAEFTHSGATFARLIGNGQTAADKARKLETDLVQVKGELSKKQAELTEQLDLIGSLDRQLQDATAQNSRLADDLAQMQSAQSQKVSEAQETERRLNNDLASLAKEIARLEDANAASQQEINALQSAYAQRLHEAQDWADKAKQAEATRDSLARASQETERRLNNDLASLAKEIVRLEDAYESAQQDLKALQSAHRAEVDTLNARLGQLQTERAEMEDHKRHRARLTSEVALLARDLTRAEDLLADERKRAEAEQNRLRQQLAGEARRLGEAHEELNRLRIAQDHLAAADRDKAARLAQEQEMVAHLQHVRDALLSSTSWKITSPVRSIVRLLRGGK